MDPHLWDHHRVALIAQQRSASIMLRLNGSKALLLQKLPKVSQKPLKSCCYPWFSK